MPSWRWKNIFSTRKNPTNLSTRRQQGTKQPGGVGQEAGCCQEGKTGFRPIGSQATLAHRQGTGAPRCALTKGSGCAAGTQVWQQ